MGPRPALDSRNGPSGNRAGRPKKGISTSPLVPSARSPCTPTTSPRRSAASSSSDTVGRERETKRTPSPSRRTQRCNSRASSGATTTCVGRALLPARSRPASSQLPTWAVSEMSPPDRLASRSTPSTLPTWEVRSAASCRFVETRSLKHMAKSVNTRTVSVSSWDPVAPVKRIIAFWIAARSVGMRDGARRPICRASASRNRRGTQLNAAASR